MRPVGDVAEAVVPEVEKAIGRRRGDIGREGMAERAVELAVDVLACGEHEGNVEQCEGRHTLGKIARVEVAELEPAVGDHREAVGRLMAEIRDICGHLDAPARVARAPPARRRRGAPACARMLRPGSRRRESSCHFARSSLVLRGGDGKRESSRCAQPFSRRPAHCPDGSMIEIIAIRYFLISQASPLS